MINDDDDNDNKSMKKGIIVLGFQTNNRTMNH